MDVALLRFYFTLLLLHQIAQRLWKDVWKNCELEKFGRQSFASNLFPQFTLRCRDSLTPTKTIGVTRVSADVRTENPAMRVQSVTPTVT